MKQEIHDAKYINWRKEANLAFLTQSEWNEKMDWIEARGKEIELGVGHNTIRSYWHSSEWSFSVYDDKRTSALYISHTKGKGFNKVREYQRFITYKHEDKNERVAANVDLSTPGKDGVELVQSLFNGRTKKSLRVAFGYISKLDDYLAIRKCAVAAPPMIWVNPLWVGEEFHHGYKADISSAYPFNCCGNLPDWHTVEVIPGRQEPSEEYPFVYWNDGHHAEWNRYDTREFVKNKYFLATNDKDKNKLDAFKQEGILVSYCCKAATDQMTEEMYELYSRKENAATTEDKNYWKNLFVSFIGKFFEDPFREFDAASKKMKKSNKPRATQYPMPHIAATCHGRQIKQMLDIIKVLEKEGNEPISFATDSIIWCGKRSKTTTVKDFKVLGSFVSEFEDVDFAFGGTGLYALAKDGKIGLIKHMGKIGDKYKAAKSLKEFLDICANDKLQEYIGYDKNTRRYIKKWRF